MNISDKHLGYMKQSSRILVALATLLLATACSKDLHLGGTTWTHQSQYTFNDEGLMKDISLDFTLSFADATTGTMKRKMDMSYEGIGLNIHVNGSGPLTYTRNGNEGTMTVSFTNEQTGDIAETTTHTWRYDPDAGTLTVTFDEDYQKQWNLKEAVFKKK